VFVLEEVQRDFGANVFTATLATSVTADIVARLLLGQTPCSRVDRSDPELTLLPLASVVGLAAAVFGARSTQPCSPPERVRPHARTGCGHRRHGRCSPDWCCIAPLVGTGRALMDGMLTGDIGLLALTGMLPCASSSSSPPTAWRAGRHLQADADPRRRAGVAIGDAASTL
jgi:hypothetical protein